MEYLRSVWAAVMPAKGKRELEYADVEAHGCGGAESVVLVTEALDVRVQVRPLLHTHDLYDIVNGV
jgi:hypothetical protein